MDLELITTDIIIAFMQSGGDYECGAEPGIATAVRVSEEGETETAATVGNATPEPLASRRSPTRSRTLSSK